MRRITATALVAAVLFINAGSCRGDDYLVDFRIGNKKLGQYLMSGDPKNGYTLAADAYRALNLPVTDDQNISLLKEYGAVDFNSSRQSLVFTPDANKKSLFDPKKLAEAIKPDRVIAPSNNKIGFKAVDYQLSYNLGDGQKGQFYGFGNLIGRIGPADVAFRYSSNNDTALNALYRNESNGWLRGAEVGRLSNYNIDGLAVSNERYNRSGLFGKQTYTVFGAAGTRIDVYRNGVFINSETIQNIPLEIPFDLVYGDNLYDLYKYTPDGKVEIEHIKKTVDNYLVKKGELNYYVAGGRTSVGRDASSVGRFAYGITNELTFEAEEKWTDGKINDPRITAYYRPNDMLFFQASAINGGYSLGGRLDAKKVSIDASQKSQWGNTLTSISTAFKNRYNPVFVFTRDAQKNGSTEILRSQIFFSKYFSFLSANVSLNPTAEFKTSNHSGCGQEIKTGGNFLVSLPKALRFQGNYIHSFEMQKNTKDRDRLELNIVKDLRDLGTITLKAVAENQPNEAFKVQSVGVRADLYRFKYAAVSVDYTHTIANNNDTALLQITGSLALKPLAFVKDFQGDRAVANILAYNDKNGDGKRNEGEELIKDASIETSNGQTYKLPTLITEQLTPFTEYFVIPDSAFGFVPNQRKIAFTASRGQAVDVEIPYTELIDLEGTIPSKKDGVLISIVNTETGKTVKTVRTTMDGYYYTTIPASMQSKIKVEIADQKVLEAKK